MGTRLSEWILFTQFLSQSENKNPNLLKSSGIIRFPFNVLPQLLRLTSFWNQYSTNEEINNCEWTPSYLLALMLERFFLVILPCGYVLSIQQSAPSQV